MAENEKPICDGGVLADKERLRALDREIVASGQRSWAEVNRANAIAGSIGHLYRPSMKFGLPR